MDLYSIYTDRHVEKWPSHQIIYEWEDEISNQLTIPIHNSPYIRGMIPRKVSGLLRRIIHNDLTEIMGITNKNTIQLYFEMLPKNFRSFSNRKKVIPVIIDFWHKASVDIINKYYKDCPFILISSLEVLNFLKVNSCYLNLIHFPLSLPDKYRLKTDQVFKKYYDVVLAGRANPILWEYLKNYEFTHPEIEYLFQELKNGELYYRSNKNGIIGKYQNRDEYFDLIRSAKISLYSTPGIDGGEKRTGGFNPVTPKFLESLSAGCHVIARYQQNEESDFYQLDTICPSVNSYEEFEKQMDFAMNSNILPIKRNSDYLLKHYTSVRIETLKKVFNKI